jgi:hypothetical protein
MVPSTLSSLDRVNWIPVNHVAKIVIELAGLCGKQDVVAPCPSMSIFHGVNPFVRSWSSLVHIVASSLGSDIAVVPWMEWLSALEASERGPYSEKNPGIKLLDFYKNVDKAGTLNLQLPVLETKITQVKSDTLRTLGPVKEDWMSQWMKQWGL